jgi:hypothetical protein
MGTNDSHFDPFGDKTTISDIRIWNRLIAHSIFARSNGRENKKGRKWKEKNRTEKRKEDGSEREKVKSIRS